MYNVYNDNGELIAEQIDEDALIDLANEEFAETDNIDDALENDLLFYDNVYDAKESLEAFGYEVKEKCSVNFL